MKKLRQILNLISLKLMRESELLIKIIFLEVFIIDSLLKTNTWTYKIKDLIGEKTIGSFYKKELLLSIL